MASKELVQGTRYCVTTSLSWTSHWFCNRHFGPWWWWNLFVWEHGINNFSLQCFPEMPLQYRIVVDPWWAWCFATSWPCHCERFPSVCYVFIWQGRNKVEVSTQDSHVWWSTSCPWIPKEKKTTKHISVDVVDTGRWRLCWPYIKLV